MKKIIIIAALLTAAEAKVDRDQISLKFAQIAKERITIADADLRKHKSPFKPNYANSSAGGANEGASGEGFSFELQATVAGRAKIGGEWFAKGAKLPGGYTLTAVGNGTAILRSAKNQKNLHLKENKNVSLSKK